MDFGASADRRVKIKESEKRDKFQDLAREQKKLWNIKVSVILIVIGVLGKVSRRSVMNREDLEVRGRLETIKN